MVIISNGFSKFHLSVAAAEADRRRLLSSFLTGAYPTPSLRRILALPGLLTNTKLNRLTQRGEQIDDRRVHPFFSAEALYALGILRGSDAMIVRSFCAYGHFAVHYVERAAADGARVYHYRAGFGGESVEVAKRLGLLALCDHSIAHPAVLQALVENMGVLPSPIPSNEISPVWKHVLRDMERADAVLVNSRFVRDTFRHVGFDCTRVHVIYLGIDDAFFGQVLTRKRAPDEFRLLFAGSFGRRKGAEILIEALGRLDTLPWHLEIAGQMNSNIVERNPTFFSDSRVTCLGVLSRQQLAAAMSRAHAFIFPSLAEGSARVIFEALASGCYVITTPNSGSIVEDGVHGSVVPPGDSSSLAIAVEDAYHHQDRISEIGSRNAQLVKSKYRQCHYGEQLSGLYGDLLGEACHHREVKAQAVQ
jgi:glycosyltransferase involved in cell wall biosynthesis